MKIQHKNTALINVTVRVTDAISGDEVQRIDTHNLITRAGLNLIRDYIANLEPEGVSHLAIGTSNTAPANADTALGDEKGRFEITLTTTPGTGSTQFEHFVGANQMNGHTFQEAGLLTDSGTLFARVIHDPLPKTSAIAITYTWTVEINRG